jgi:hypothetical protein
MAYRVERLNVRVPAVVGQLEEAREDVGEARPPRRRLLGQWHGAGAGCKALGWGVFKWRALAACSSRVADVL